MRLIYLLLIIFWTNSLFSQNWTNYIAEDATFSIFSPDSFEHSSQIITTEISEFEVHSLHVSYDDYEAENYLYLITFYDLPEGMVDIDSIQLLRELLEESMTQSVEDNKGILLYQQEEQMGKFPALLWRVSNQESMIKAKAVITDDRFYLIQVFTVLDKELNNSVDKFIDSFYLLK